MMKDVTDLGDGLVMRSVRDERDIEQYVALHAQVVSAGEGRTCENLLTRHPAMNYADFMVIEDVAAQQIVATICLIPWECRFEGIELRAAMLEMVVTHPDYRRRGLVRALIERFHRVTAERGFDLCLIEGIPYYYRQFGYAYAVDHRSYDVLAASAIPGGTWEAGQRYAFRPASSDDAPVLTELYREAMAPVAFHVKRDATYWRYLLECACFPVQLVIDQMAGQAVGYVVVPPMNGKGTLTIIESAVNGHDVGMAVLCRLRAETSGVLNLAWPQTGDLVQAARGLGSKPNPTYQWLFRIPDPAAFLLRIGPALERRLAASDCVDWTGEITINLFRQAFRLRFAGGTLIAVDAIGFVDSSMGADGGDLCIPPDAFVRLALGYRGLAGLWDAWPDIVVRAESRHLFDILFPELTSYLCTPYFYLGPI